MDERSRAFADHHINTEILHGDVQQFLGGTGQTVDLIDKEHLAGVQRTQNRSQITSMLDGGTGSDADWNFQFIGHNHGQSGFAKSRRPRQAGYGPEERHVFEQHRGKDCNCALSLGCPMNPSRI